MTFTLTAPEQRAEHPQLTVTDRHTPPTRPADLTVLFGDPGTRAPNWSGVTGPFEEGGSEVGATHLIGGYPGSGPGGIRGGAVRAAQKRAQAILDAGGHVVIACATGRVRSVSFALMLLSHLHPHDDTQTLLERLVQLRPEAAGGLDGDGSGLTLLRFAARAVEYDRDTDFDLTDCRNARWI